MKQTTASRDVISRADIQRVLDLDQQSRLAAVELYRRIWDGATVEAGAAVRIDPFSSPEQAKINTLRPCGGIIIDDISIDLDVSAAEWAESEEFNRREIERMREAGER